MNKKKDPWWWNLIATLAGIVLLISSIFDYDKFITVDHNDTSKSRGFADFLASLDDMGGQKFVVTFLVVFVFCFGGVGYWGGCGCFFRVLFLGFDLLILEREMERCLCELAENEW